MSALKSIVALLGAIAAAVIPVLAVGPLDVSGWFNVIALGAGAATVYIAENQAAGVWRYAKAICSVVAAVAVVVASTISGGITIGELIQIAAAAATALGVAGLRNKGQYDLAS